MTVETAGFCRRIGSEEDEDGEISGEGDGYGFRDARTITHIGYLEIGRMINGDIRVIFGLLEP